LESCTKSPPDKNNLEAWIGVHATRSILKTSKGATQTCSIQPCRSFHRSKQLQQLLVNGLIMHVQIQLCGSALMLVFYIIKKYQFKVNKHRAKPATN